MVKEYENTQASLARVSDLELCKKFSFAQYINGFFFHETKIQSPVHLKKIIQGSKCN